QSPFGSHPGLWRKSYSCNSSVLVCSGHTVEPHLRRPATGNARTRREALTKENRKVSQNAPPALPLALPDLTTANEQGIHRPCPSTLPGPGLHRQLPRLAKSGERVWCPPGSSAFCLARIQNGLTTA